MTTIPFILGGPSGVGKSHFCAFLKNEGWLYLEGDGFSGPGIDGLNLRKPWDEFWNCYNPRPLAQELTTRRDKDGRSGVVLSLPSNAIPTPKHIESAKSILNVRFLYGHPSFCLRDFLERERTAGRNLSSVDHWDAHNRNVFATLSTSLYHNLLIEVFMSDGSRIPWNEVAKRI